MTERRELTASKPFHYLNSAASTEATKYDLENPRQYSDKLISYELPRLPQRSPIYVDGRTSPGRRKISQPIYLNPSNYSKQKSLPKVPQEVHVSQKLGPIPASLFSSNSGSNSRSKYRQEEWPDDEASLRVLHPSLVSKFNIARLQTSRPGTPYASSSSKMSDQRSEASFLESPILPKRFDSVTTSKYSVDIESPMLNSSMWPKPPKRIQEQEQEYGDGGLGLFLYPYTVPEGYWDLMEMGFDDEDLDDEDLDDGDLDDGAQRRFSFEGSVFEADEHFI